MTQVGKSNAAKKGKPSYFMSILGVTIVLFMWGVFGLVYIYVKKYNQSIREKVLIEVSLSDVATQKDIDSLSADIKSKSYLNTFKYISKEEAFQRAISDKNIALDTNLTNGMPNFLPNEIEFTLKSDFVNKDTIAIIKDYLLAKDNIVAEVRVPNDVIASLSGIYNKAKWWLLVIASILTLVSMIQIDNTIRLAMYSNRFLIKTMQMVGATRNFIALPMDKRAIINGLISAGIAILLLYGVIGIVESYVPDLRILKISSLLFWLFFGIIFLGVLITLISTHRSVIKYLKMRLDDLY